MGDDPAVSGSGLGGERLSRLQLAAGSAPTRSRLVDGCGAANPLGRIAKPEDIARAALYLASDQAGFVTGHTLHVNGGSYLY